MWSGLTNWAAVYDGFLGSAKRDPGRVLRMLTVAFFWSLAAVALWLIIHQVVGAPEMMKTHDRQLIRRIHLPPERGSILDCNGIAIRSNAPSFKFVLYLDALIDPRDGRKECLRKIGQAVIEFAKLFDTPTYRRLLRTEIELQNALSANGPLGLVLNKDFEPSDQMMATWAVHRGTFPHIRLERRLRRVSAYPGCLAHAVGDVRLEAPIVPRHNPAMKSGHPRDRYHIFQKEARGVSGMENQLDSILRGSPGAEVVIVTARGFKRATVISKTAPTPGRHVYTTIDIRLQKIAEQAFFADGRCGAFVITTCADGAVRALGSSPTPPLKSTGANWDAIMSDPSHPLLNRATQSLYSPGSTIKVILAQAFLASGKTTADEMVDCGGKQYIDGLLRGCKRAHGKVCLRDALRLSCNTYFHEMGLRVGDDYLRDWLQLAYGCSDVSKKNDAKDGPHRLRIRGSRIMTPRDEGRWRDFENWLLCIGQGQTEVSMPSMANAVAALVTGVVFRPHIFRDGTGAPVSPDQHVICHLDTTPAIRREVLQGMIDVVHGNPATGRRARVPGLLVAGKTGTAERELRSERRVINNTLMVALVPARAPKYAICCVIEDGESGGRTVAPRLKKVIEGMLKAGLVVLDEEAEKREDS
ncbi:MAG: hypothetical protein KAI66_02645 [Lentisphaeria bacterium]|nr:hypothetical protein [Lentisphaeria bacterium]